MELTCGLVLMIVGFAIASPHGYGTKGGAAAKADASAAAGAYTGVGEIPLNIPGGAGFSGSFSKSYSSSSASSSASSSSSSFSYSGSGVVGGVNGCGSGSCNGKGTIGSPGSAAAGSQAYSGSNAGSLTAGKTPSDSYGHKYSSDGSHAKGSGCGSEGCSTDNLTHDGNSAATGSQSTSDAKASSVAGNLAGSNCAGPECNNLSSDGIKCSSGQCDSNKKCSTGDCREASDTGAPLSPNQDTEESPSVDYGNNDIHIKTPGAPGSDCSNGGCDSATVSASHTLQSYNKPVTHLTAPKPDTACSGTNCQNGQSFSSTDYSNPLCNGGNCDYSQTKAAPSTISQNVNQISQSTSSNAYGRALNNKPTYSHGSSPSYSASSPVCAPGTSNCVTAPSGPSDCASGDCGPYSSVSGQGGSSSMNPSKSSSSLSLVNPSGFACAPGTPGCTLLPSPPSVGCVTGSCGLSSPGYEGPSNVNPSYSHGSSPSYSPGGGGSLDTSCAPGTPGCGITPSISDPSECAPGTCGSYPSAPGHSGGSNTKPSYSHLRPLSYFPGKPLGPGCAPGTPGCVTAPSANSPSDCASGNCDKYPSTHGYGGPSITKPSYPHGSLPSVSLGKPSGLDCAPGTPGCTAGQFASSPSDCSSGNCDKYPPRPGYGGSSIIIPGYPHASSPSNSLGKPLGPDCTPGTPGCGTAPSASSPSNCALGNCGAYPSLPGYGFSSIKPYSSPYSPLRPSVPDCTPGTPGCASLLTGSGSSGCTSGNCGSYPSSSYGTVPSYSQIKPSGAACAPGTPGCTTSSSSNYLTGCTSGNCGAYPTSQGCAPGTPGCSSSRPSGLPSVHPASGSFVPGSEAQLPLPNSPAGTGIPGPSYGASSSGSSLNQASFGTHNSGSYHKPSSGFPAGSSGSGGYSPTFPLASGVSPGIGSQSPSYAGGIAGSNSQQGAKEDHPYAGGFGGPAGILRPNEFKAPTTPHDYKPTSNEQTSIKPVCASGICDQSASSTPSHAHTGSGTGAQASAGASASADAIAYTGGFGGPPGFLKPYDNGKVDVKPPGGKPVAGSSFGLHGIGASGIHSTHTNGGSQVGGSAVAQANAAAVSSAGVSGDYNTLHGGNGAHNNGHDSTGGCGGGCGGSGGGNYGHSGSHGLSKTGVLDDSSTGLATAGAVAKSVASASSGARSYGGSYSSSASAHATSGASVKGGYGRR